MNTQTLTHTPTQSHSIFTLQFFAVIIALVFISGAIYFFHTMETQQENRRRNAKDNTSTQKNKKKKRIDFTDIIQKEKEDECGNNQSIFDNDDENDEEKSDYISLDEERLEFSSYLKKNSYFCYSSSTSSGLATYEALVSRKYENRNSSLYALIEDNERKQKMAEEMEIQRRRNFQVKKKKEEQKAKQVSPKTNLSVPSLNFGDSKSKIQKSQGNGVNKSFNSLAGSSGSLKKDEENNIKGLFENKSPQKIFPAIPPIDLGKGNSKASAAAAASSSSNLNTNNLTQDKVQTKQNKQKLSSNEGNGLSKKRPQQLCDPPRSFQQQDEKKRLKELEQKQEKQRLQRQRQQKQKAQKAQKAQKQKTKNNKQKETLTNSFDFLQMIINTSITYNTSQQIKAKLSNFGGARSDVHEIYSFTKTFLSKIDKQDKKQVQSFSHKVWDFVVNTAIRGSNVKDGFQAIPPKEKNSQVEKNQIITLVIIINLFRVMGFEQVWIGIFGKTLSMLKFLYQRQTLIEGLETNSKKKPEQVFANFDLMKIKYVAKQGDMSSKYLSRLDFLTYFLIGLTTLDPILFFQEIQNKSQGQKIDFLPELKDKNFKWQYAEFWCLVDQVNRNPFPGYFKIPFWSNVISLIYLQRIQNYREKTKKEQFIKLQEHCFKLIKSLVSSINKEKENKLIMDIEIENKSYDFDGEAFISTIKTLGRSMEQKEKQMIKSKDQRTFREKHSILYYFSIVT